MTDQLLKEANLARRNAKAALTRMTKSLRYLIEKERPEKEVRDALSKVQGAYETLIEKHEQFTKLIEEDEKFEEEEAWLEESQYMLMYLETDTKLYLENQLPINVQERQPDDNENRNESEISISELSKVDNAESDANSVQLVNGVDKRSSEGVEVVKKETCSFKIEKPKMPKFYGDVREYAIFRSDFKHAVEARYSKRDAITILRTCLQGKPLDLIKGTGSDYDAAWSCEVSTDT